MKGLLHASLNGSLFIQIVTLILNFVGLAKEVGIEHFLLKEALYLETAVQIVQLVFYTWYKYHLRSAVTDVAKYRYYDWIITTPLMLFTTLCFYVYMLERQEKSTGPYDTMKDILTKHWNPILQIVGWNALMLLMGYLQELRVLPVAIATPIGFLGLFGSFSTMYKHFVEPVEDKFIFKFMAFLWSLYGGIALLPDIPKNIGFNIIDIFSKNFYGVYLSYFIYQLA
jgi:bacteriorhodopsin